MSGATLRRASAAAALAAALPLAGCWVPIERGRQMEARIQRLEVQSVEQERTLGEQRQTVRERVEKVDQKIREVQAKIDELNQAARRSGADLGVQLGRLQEDFTRVKGELEVAQHQLDGMDKQVSALKADTDARFTALKGQGALDAYEAKQRIASLPKPDDKNAFFALAQKEDASGDKGVARELYDEYARRWPGDPRSAEAGMRAGDLYAAQKRYREALLAYGKVAESFPRSDRAPDAMLGAADSMVSLEMKDDAVSVLQQLVEKYPKAPAAAKARARLAELAPPRAEKAEKAEKPAEKKKAPTHRK